MIKSQINHYYGKQKGFTLIEVLVASVILFASIAIVSMLYRGALTSSNVAARNMEVSGVVQPILATIRKEVRVVGSNPLTRLDNTGEFYGVPFRWEAELISFKAPAKKLDPETGKYLKLEPKYKLWKVILNIAENREYSYYEVSWVDD